LLSDALLKATGWQIEVVPGLIPTVAFLQLLKEKKFPSSTWLRSMAQLDYLEEPDMFHDIFGHVPLLFDPEYANLMQAIGELGIRHQSNPSVIDAIERFYWYTIEFGLSSHNENMRIYGAGILSSFGETNAIFSPTAPPIDAYNLNDILTRPFRKDEMQTRYFLLPQLETLYEQEQILQQSFQVQPLH
jgi:phenylalanine-4-hydroxylase